MTSSGAKRESSLPRIFIAHQSAIPHYRVRFYRQLNGLAAGHYHFYVLYNPDQVKAGDFAGERLPEDLGFSIIPAPIRRWNIGKRQLLWQSIARHTKHASLLITDTHLANLGYPHAALTRARTCKWALWGHTANRNLPAAARHHMLPRITAALKRRYLQRADAFFAYTETERQSAISLGIRPERSYTIGNTIDLMHQRDIALRQQSRRSQIRTALGFGPDDFIIITVGRLLPGRRIEFLLDAFNQIQNPAARMIIIGGGEVSQLPVIPDTATITGPITDPEQLGRYLTAADLYVAPGMVGLGILQPLAHELPLIAFDLETHGPEIDYLTAQNSTILPAETTPRHLADHITSLITTPPDRWDKHRYQSIAHLTLEAMAQNFHNAVLHLLP